MKIILTITFHLIYPIPLKYILFIIKSNETEGVSLSKVPFKGYNDFI